jgi:hypothetical protein
MSAKKQKRTLSVADFTTLLDNLCSQSSAELQRTRSRLEHLRSSDLPG